MVLGGSNGGLWLVGVGTNGGRLWQWEVVWEWLAMVWGEVVVW